jgi:hypothetical protein
VHLGVGLPSSYQQIQLKEGEKEKLMASLSTCMALCFRIHDASGLRMEEH